MQNNKALQEIDQDTKRVVSLEKMRAVKENSAKFQVEAKLQINKLGHSNMQMTQRYVHLAQGTLQNAVKSLERSLEKKEMSLNRNE